MIDAHTHLENGDLSIEYVHKFIDAAKEKGITHLQVLDHTHRFFEFKDCYKRVCEVSTLQEEWFLKTQKNSIDDYLKLIEALKKETFDIDVRFGLEVCYTPETESLLSSILKNYHFDFLPGRHVRVLGVRNAGASAASGMMTSATMFASTISYPVPRRRRRPASARMSPAQTVNLSS